MKHHRSLVPTFVAALLSILVFGESTSIARVVIYTFLQKTRQAPFIAVGTITELRTASVLVKIDRVLKGIERPAQIEVTWDRQGNIEEPPIRHQVGDSTLVFASRSGNLYAPFGGPQGTVKLEPGAAAQSIAAVEKILEFDSGDSAAKTRALQEMLTANNRLSQVPALEIIYLESPKNAFVTDPLIQPTMRLARGNDVAVAVNAVQALGRIADKSVIPGLIELVASPDSRVAETAAGVLKALTGGRVAVDAAQPLAERAAAARRSAEWWESNKDAVVLVR